ncbi:MAG: hypothetical protein ACOCWB_05790, partial [Bacteroidota bacterium]
MSTRKIILSVILTVVCFVVQAQQFTRVVSLAPSITQNINYLNAQKNLIGCTNYCILAKSD